MLIKKEAVSKAVDLVILNLFQDPSAHISDPDPDESGRDEEVREFLDF